jgi:hypothetical protein
MSEGKCQNSFMSRYVFSEVNIRSTPTLVTLKVRTPVFERTFGHKLAPVYSTLSSTPVTLPNIYQHSIPHTSTPSHIPVCYMLAHTHTVYATIQYLSCCLSTLSVHYMYDLLVFNWRSVNNLQPGSFQHYITYVFASTDVATPVGHVIVEAAPSYVFYCFNRSIERGSSTAVDN